MRPVLLLFFSIFCAALVGQTDTRGQWELYLEVSATHPRLQDAPENVGNAVGRMARIGALRSWAANDRLVIATGLTWRLASVTQQTQVEGRMLAGTPTTPSYVINASNNLGYLEWPVELRFHLQEGYEGWYLKAGHALSFLVASSTSAERIDGNANADDPTLWPGGDVNTKRSANFLSLGIGYRIEGPTGRAISMEPVYTFSTGPVMEHAGPRDAINRVNYLRTAGLHALGIKMILEL